MSAVLTPTPSQIAILVTTLKRMVALLPGVFGLMITVRWHWRAVQNSLVSMSSRERHHYQLVLESRRQKDAAIGMVTQTSLMAPDTQVIGDLTAKASFHAASQVLGLKRCPA